MHAHDIGDGGSVMVGSLFSGKLWNEVLFDHSQVKVPSLRFWDLIHFISSFLGERKWSETWWDIEAFLSTGITSINTPFIESELDTTN